MGYLRLFLSLMVVLNHLHSGLAYYTGPLAVFGFYTLSGFLITGALTTSYANRPIAFTLNRALRLFPAYWVAVLLGAVAVTWFTPINDAMTAPGSLDDIWRQVAIFGLLHIDGGAHPVRLVPPAWSLNMELAWYLLMMVTVRIQWVWLSIGAMIAGYAAFNQDYALSYNTYLGPTFCFALGSVAFRYKHNLPINWPIPLAALIAVMVAGNFIPGSAALLYVSSIVTAAFLLALSNNKAHLPLDRLAGDLSYPVFLCHWAVASMAFSLGVEKGWQMLIVATMATVLLSAVIVFFVERPVEGLRHHVRRVPAPAV